MIVLDTNVLSETMKPTPSSAVRAWLNEQAAETLYLSSVTLAELMFGIGADGRRKAALTEMLGGLLEHASISQNRRFANQLKYDSLSYRKRTAGKDDAPIF
ncbi:PIN domain-containing protein [Rhizobium lentis]|nr:PIN domain-containing protein [Rhizobium lentis]MBX5062796.1 PIN domain-containing protein [Rhizobium lentis]